MAQSGIPEMFDHVRVQGEADIVRSGVLRLIFQPIPKPAVNDLPLLVANRTKIEKVGLFIL